MRAILALLVLLALGAPAAQAETWSGTDPARDVTQFVARPPTGPNDCSATEPRPARHDRRRDVVGLAVAHGVDDVVVTATLRAVARRDRRTLPTFSLGTPEHRYLVNVLTDSGRKPAVELDKDPEVDIDRCLTSIGSEVVRCRGLDLERHPGAHTIVVTVPRSCLEEPLWVRAGVALSGYALRSAGSRLAVFTDVWNSDGTPTRRDAIVPPLGPPVTAG